MAIARIFLGLVLIFIFVAFSLKNMGPVSIDLYFRKTPELPLFVWLFFAALFGVIVAWIVALSEQLRMRRELRRERKEKEELEEKLGKLKKEIEQLEDRLSKQREILGRVEVPSGNASGNKEQETSHVEHEEPSKEAYKYTEGSEDSPADEDIEQEDTDKTGE
jgi:uncharacterized integral membrane protein